MAAVETKVQPAPVSAWRRFSEMTRDVQRGFIAEWSVTIILLLFATTTLVQAFVIPSASMESSLLIGDHVLVDKLVFAPSGPATKHLLPYRDVRRGDIIVFRYPVDITQDYVKRGMSAYVEKVQEPEFSARERGYTFVSHQQEVGTGYFDEVTTVIQGGKSSVTALTGSTEAEQFH